MQPLIRTKKELIARRGEFSSGQIEFFGGTPLVVGRGRVAMAAAPDRERGGQAYPALES
jgi:hypothetical protein